MPTSQDDPISIRALGVDDAAALGALFARCYGESYVVADFYEPETLATRIRAGSLRSVVAVTAAGKIVGHMGLTLRRPGATTVDAGNSVVDPACRGRQLMGRLAAAVVTLCREGGFTGFHHYPTTAHPIMQRFAVESGGTETGILLDHVPADTEYVGIDTTGMSPRRAVIVVFQALAPVPERLVHLPDSLADTLRSIYERGRWPRRITRCEEVPLGAATRLVTHVDPRRGLVRIEIARVGAEVAECVIAVLDDDRPVHQVDLRLDDPAVSHAVEALRALGFCFAALLPEYLDGDVLRLQRVHAITTPRDALTSEHARDLLDRIAADHVRTQGRSGLAGAGRLV